MKEYGGLVNPKWQNNVDFTDVKIKLLYIVLKPTLWPLFQYITAHQILLVSFCGPMEHTDCNYMT